MSTLAAWTDNEWVFGGAGPGGGTPGVGTSQFEVQQAAWETVAPTVGSSTFADFEANPGDALVFGVDPGQMTPGDTIFAPVALTTTPESIAGTVQLQKPVPAAGYTADDPDGDLWAALRYSVRVTGTAGAAENCRTDFANSGTSLVAGKTMDEDLSAASAQSLQARRGNVQYYCFAITLPDTPAAQALQGRTVFPAWEFAATSQ